MNIASVADVKSHFSDYLRKCAERPVIVTKNGRPAAVLLSVTNEDELERIILAHTPKFMAALDEAFGRIKEKGGVKHGAFWRKANKRKKK